jgi:capsid protein
VKETIIDKIIAKINPIAGLNRYRARAMYAIAHDYTSAKKNKRQTKNWQTTDSDADTDLRYARDTIVARSRSLIRNSSISAGIINNNCTNIVGTGLKKHSRINKDFLNMTDDEAVAWQKKADSEFELWAESFDCDVTRSRNFYDIQELAFRQILENGESFITTPFVSRTKDLYSMRLQLIESDRITNENRMVDGVLPNKNKLAFGIEKNNNGAPVI